jgi:release factor glutamine methyltransferase
MLKTKLLRIWSELWVSPQDIELLALYHLNISKNEFFLLDKIDNPEKIMSDYKKISEWYPIQYIVQSCEFYGREFYVDTDVLVPRIDTEILIDSVKQKSYPNSTQYLDVGTGSGIIPITLALELWQKITIAAFDISAEALEVCKKNIVRYSLEKNIHTFKSDLLENFWELQYVKERKLVITANLPYIKQKDFENMSKSTVLYEPDIALYGWEETWFEMYERLISQCIILWKEWYDIDLFIEIWFDQKEIAAQFLQGNQLDFEFHRDSATIERVVEIHF